LKESRFNFMTFDSDIMLNYQLSQKFKLVGRDKFNYIIITLTIFTTSIIKENASQSEVQP
jgi:hypothetical protein